MSTGLCELDFHNVATSQAVKLRICQTWFISLSDEVCINIMSVFHNCKQSVGVCVCVCVHICRYPDYYTDIQLYRYPDY